MKISIILRVFSDRSFVSSRRGGGGGADGGGGNSWVGAIVWRGGGVNSGGVLNPNIRPSHHTYKSPKQFELKGSKST